MGLRQIREEVSNIIRDARPLFNVYPVVPPIPVYPAVVVAPSNDTCTTYTNTMGGMNTHVIDVWVALPYTEMTSGQEALDDELDMKNPDSLVRALKANPTLNGVVDDMTVSRVMFYGRGGTGEAGGSPWISAVIKLEVMEC